MTMLVAVTSCFLVLFAVSCVTKEGTSGRNFFINGHGST